MTFLSEHIQLRKETELYKSLQVTIFLGFFKIQYHNKTKLLVTAILTKQRLFQLNFY